MIFREVNFPIFELNLTTFEVKNLKCITNGHVNVCSRGLSILINFMIFFIWSLEFLRLWYFCYFVYSVISVCNDCSSCFASGHHIPPSFLYGIIMEAVELILKYPPLSSPNIYITEKKDSISIFICMYVSQLYSCDKENLNNNIKHTILFIK